MEQKFAKIPLEENQSFLEEVKAQLLSLRKRIRHETLQKLELLRQFKDVKLKLEETKNGNVSKAIQNNMSVQCELGGDLVYKRAADVLQTSERKTIPHTQRRYSDLAMDSSGQSDHISLLMQQRNQYQNSKVPKTSLKKKKVEPLESIETIQETKTDLAIQEEHVKPANRRDSGFFYPRYDERGSKVERTTRVNDDNIVSSKVVEPTEGIPEDRDTEVRQTETRQVTPSAKQVSFEPSELLQEAADEKLEAKASYLAAQKYRTDQEEVLSGLESDTFHNNFQDLPEHSSPETSRTAVPRHTAPSGNQNSPSKITRLTHVGARFTRAQSTTSMERPAQIMGQVSLETTHNENEDNSKNSKNSVGEQSYGPKKPTTDRVQPPRNTHL